MNGKRKQTMGGQHIFCLACVVLMAAASIVLAIMLLTSGLLGKGIVWAIVGGLVLLNGLHGWLQLGRGKTGTGRTVCGDRRVPPHLQGAERGHLCGRLRPGR